MMLHRSMRLKPGSLITRGIRAIHLEAKLAVPVLRRQANIVEHRCSVKQFRVMDQVLAFACQGCPEVDTGGVSKQQFTFGVANELSHLACQLAVGNFHLVNITQCHGYLSPQ
jgi:hypothetical protein